jgi:hypothetical protein
MHRERDESCSFYFDGRTSCSPSFSQIDLLFIRLAFMSLSLLWLLLLCLLPVLLDSCCKLRLSCRTCYMKVSLSLSFEVGRERRGSRRREWEGEREAEKERMRRRDRKKRERERERERERRRMNRVKEECTRGTCLRSPLSARLAYHFIRIQKHLNLYFYPVNHA